MTASGWGGGGWRDGGAGGGSTAAAWVAGKKNKNATYLLGQYGDGLLVFGVAKVDAVDGQDGVADVQPPAPVRGLGGMDLGNQNGNAVLLPTLIGGRKKKTKILERKSLAG